MLFKPLKYNKIFLLFYAVYLANVLSVEKIKAPLGAFICRTGLRGISSYRIF